MKTRPYLSPTSPGTRANEKIHFGEYERHSIQRGTVTRIGCRHKRFCFMLFMSQICAAALRSRLVGQYLSRAGSWATVTLRFRQRARHACGYALSNNGHDTRAIQGWLGHRSITSTAVYAALAPNRFKDFWRD